MHHLLGKIKWLVLNQQLSYEQRENVMMIHNMQKLVIKHNRRGREERNSSEYTGV